MPASKRRASGAQAATRSGQQRPIDRVAVEETFLVFVGDVGQGGAPVLIEPTPAFAPELRCRCRRPAGQRECTE